jgi:hypothetical protein
MTPEESARVRRLRRKAARHGWYLRKISERSRLRPEYGPYMLAQPGTGKIGPKGMHLDDVDAFLEAESARDHVRSLAQ